MLTPALAITLLDQATSKINTSREGHMHLQEALNVLRALVAAQAPKPKKAEKEPETK